jgi:hypothetical protein
VVTARVQSLCAMCGQPATTVIDPPRRTLDRGPDPTDQSYSITVMLPDVPLCGEHVRDVRQGDRIVGWCDDQRCRTYGEVGETSACGEQYGALGSRNRSRTSIPKGH